MIFQTQLSPLYMCSQNKEVEKLFQKLINEADGSLVECFRLTNTDNQSWGVLFVDRQLENQKKRILESAIGRILQSGKRQEEPEPRKDQSSAVSAEERTLLFDFLNPSSPKE